MVHLPSLFVGSAVAGTALLAVHQQLSYRERLSKKWKLRELAELKVSEAWNQIKKSRDPQDTNQMRSEETSMAKIWNRGVGYLQNALRRDDS